MRVFLSRQFLKFLGTGGTAAAVNFSSRFAYNAVVPFPVAVTLAYLSGMVTGFVLAKLFVFRQASRPFAYSALLFGIVNLIAFAQTFSVSLVLAYEVLPAFGLKHNVKALANLVGIIIPVFSSFIGHKYLTFREVSTGVGLVDSERGSGRRACAVDK